MLELRDAALFVVLGGLQVLDLAVLLVATAGMKEGVVASGKSLAEALVVDTVVQAILQSPVLSQPLVTNFGKTSDGVSAVWLNLV